MNLCNLPPSERQSIELQRKASLLIHNLKRGKITRADINKAIEREDDKESFRHWLNHYREGE